MCRKRYQKRVHFYFFKQHFRDGSKFIRYPGRDHRQGGGDFSSKKIRGAKTFFQKKIRGAKTFFTIIFENPRFHFSKKAIFEDQKVIYVGSSDSSVLIGV